MANISKAPFAVRLHLTRSCNLQCIHCLSDASATPPEGELTTDEWCRLFDDLRELRIVDVSLSGGEPFCRHDIFDLLERLAAPRRHRITILTNGTLITENAAARLAQLRLRRFTLSLDGTEAQHDKVRGRGSFQLAICGLRNLLAAGLQPVVAFTPMRTNFESFGALVDLLVEMGITNIQVNRLKPEGRCTPIYPRLALRHPDDVRAMVDEVQRKRITYPHVQIQCTLGRYLFLPIAHQQFINTPLGERRPAAHLNEGCSACLTSCQITATGKVVPCEGLSDFVGGDIRRTSLKEIWQRSDEFAKVRALSEVLVGDLSDCQPCAYNAICDAGCRAVAYLVTGDLLSRDPWCPFGKRAGV
jgi:AdoMet-dependent heme synthase